LLIAVEGIMRRSIIAITVPLLLLLSACHKKDDFKPSKLVGPLYSGKSLEAVQRDLKLKAGDWDVLEDRRPLSSDKRPPFRIFTISKKGFPLLGVSGQQLIMTFYNDRLMTVQFYPYSMDAFKAALSTKDKVSISPEGDSFVAPSTRIWIGKDIQGHLYAGFIDRTLQKEYDDWVHKYDRE
jgi:hypothetical protein